MQIYSDTNLQPERLNKEAATDYHHHHHHHNHYHQHNHHHHHHHYTAKLLYEEVFEKVSILIIPNNKDVIPASATCMTPGARNDTERIRRSSAPQSSQKQNTRQF